MARYVLGVDFGTLSGRAVVVRVDDGAEVGAAVHPYRNGVMDHRLAAVARAVWHPQPDFTTATEAWLTAGGPHHTVLTTAVDVESLRDFAHHAGIELLVIDADTRAAAFADSLNWNAAYHRLVQRP